MGGIGGGGGGGGGLLEPGNMEARRSALSFIFLPLHSLAGRPWAVLCTDSRGGDNQERTYMSDSIQLYLVKVAYFTSVGGTIQILYLSKSTNKTLLKVSKITNVGLNV